jgi:Protein of unknown function DUF45
MSKPLILRTLTDQERQTLEAGMRASETFTLRHCQILLARAAGALSFSWRLILAPPSVVDYVVVHELMHIVVHNHSKQFWHTVGTILPEFLEHCEWLRQHERQLLLRKASETPNGRARLFHMSSLVTHLGWDLSPLKLLCCLVPLNSVSLGFGNCKAQAQKLSNTPSPHAQEGHGTDHGIQHP